jgi:hypothetical protein
MFKSKHDKKIFKLNLNDPIQARINENIYYFKRKRHSKIHPENTKVTNKIMTRSKTKKKNT